MEAARSAALADGLAAPTDGNNNNTAASSTTGDAKHPASSSSTTTTTSSAQSSSSNSGGARPNGLSLLAEAPGVLTKASNSIAAVDVTIKGSAAAATNITTAGQSAAARTAAAQAAAQKAAEASALAAHQAAVQRNKTAVSPKPPLSSSTANSSSSGNSSSNKSKKGPALRRGKWTAEEEAYANRLILEFKAGLLPLTDGTTLRTFLSKLLNCDPMRISKKFVGSNCIGKQVFRRRTADINRLTPDQIQQSRNELSELERRFLERVAQTNRVKSSGGGVGGGGGRPKVDDVHNHDVDANAGGVNHQDPPSPPWMCAPTSYNPNGNNKARAAAAGRALLQTTNDPHHSNAAGVSQQHRAAPQAAAAAAGAGLYRTNSHGSAGLLAMAEMQRRLSRSNLLNAAAASGMNSHPNLASGAAAGGASSGLSGTALAQIARNASAARMAAMAGTSGSSANNLIHRSGLSRDQLSQLARDQQLTSSHSLTNMMERQSSFDALMSLDIQSLQSIDNLANLIQSGSGLPQHNAPKTGIKNWSAMDGGVGSNNNLAGIHAAHRQASQERMENLIRSISNGNIGNISRAAGGHQSASASAASLLSNAHRNASFGSGMLKNVNSFNSHGMNMNMSMASLNSMLRTDSSTGLTALRMQDGLNHRNSSVDDFLSLVANGDIPHQDPHMLNVPLQSVLHATQQHQQQNHHQQGAGSAHSAAQFLARQQLLAATVHQSNSNSYLNALSGAQAHQQRAMNASALAAARSQLEQQSQGQSNSGLKRKLEVSGDLGQPSLKR